MKSNTVECLNNTGHNGQRFLFEASFGRSTLANSSKHRAPRLILTWNEEIPTGSLRNQPLPLLSFFFSFSPLSSSRVHSSGIKRYLKQGFKTNREDLSSCWSLKVYTGNEFRKGTLNAITVNLLHASVQVNACRVLWTRKCAKIVQDGARKRGGYTLGYPYCNVVNFLLDSFFHDRIAC